MVIIKTPIFVINVEYNDKGITTASEYSTLLVSITQIFFCHFDVTVHTKQNIVAFFLLPRTHSNKGFIAAFSQK